MRCVYHVAVMPDSGQHCVVLLGLYHDPRAAVNFEAQWIRRHYRGSSTEQSDTMPKMIKIVLEGHAE